jgi:hypothetical protein
VTRPATVQGMPETTEQDRQRKRAAVEREMQRRREADDEREDRELIDSVGDEQQRGRDRTEREESREG